MPNDGIFTNFMLCRCYLKKKTRRKKAKRWKMQQSVLRHNFLYVATQNSSMPKEVCHSQQLKVATKFRHSSMAKEKFYVTTMSFSVATLLKKGVKKTVATIRCSIATKIKIESKEVVLLQYNFCHNIKS